MRIYKKQDMLKAHLLVWDNFWKDIKLDNLRSQDIWIFVFTF